jgi:protein-S-isoprenylcysteine O-methyltransferase Ste14
VVLHVSEMFERRFADLLLFCVTAAELVILFLLTSTFTITDWIYVLQHFIVLGIALTRPHPKVRDYSVASSIAVAVAYLYPYAQVIYLRWSPGHVAWPAAGLVLVTLGASLSLVSLLAIGRLFGIRPALRGLVTSGPYRFVRHPMYLSYVLADIGYNLQEWNSVTLLLVFVGWISLVYRIHAEERLLSQHAEWPAYVALVRYRLFPGLW